MSDNNNNKPVSKETHHEITSWPESAPDEDEEHIVSIVCGNSHLHWAFHNSVKADLQPALFWRTPPLINEDLSGPLAESLSRHLPQYAHNHIFGKGNSASAETAVSAAAKRTLPKISVYLVSTNQDQIGLISQMWGSIPSRIILMKGDDFFSKTDGRYEKMGVDRLAVLRGAADLHGFPALVIDGGTATTYTAADAKGKILGGGIGAGLQIKLRCMHEYTDALPLVGPQDAVSRVKEALDRKKTLQIFSRDTTDAMLASVLGEYASFGRTVVNHWLGKVGQPKSGKTNTGQENHERTVMITGGDGEILSQLMRPNHSGIIEATEAQKKETPFNIVHSKQLIHYGIAAAIMKQVCLRRQQNEIPDDSVSTKSPHLKARVAKKFDQPDAEGDFIFRGSVTSVFNNAKGEMFTIRYDDGDREQVDFTEFKNLLQLFKKVGEKKKKTKVTPATPKKSAVAPKKKPNSDKPALKPDKPALKPDKQALKPDPKPASKPEKKTPKADKPAGISTKRLKRKASSIESRDPRSLLKKRIAKDFDGLVFYGQITQYEEEDGDEWWHVIYDDGDEEDLEKNELVSAFKFYKKVKKNDKKRSPATELSSGDESDSSSKRGKAKTSASIKKDNVD